MRGDHLLQKKRTLQKHLELCCLHQIQWQVPLLPLEVRAGKLTWLQWMSSRRRQKAHLAMSSTGNCRHLQRRRRDCGSSLGGSSSFHRQQQKAQMALSTIGNCQHLQRKERESSSSRSGNSIHPQKRKEPPHQTLITS